MSQKKFSILEPIVHVQSKRGKTYHKIKNYVFFDDPHAPKKVLDVERFSSLAINWHADTKKHPYGFRTTPKSESWPVGPENKVHKNDRTTIGIFDQKVSVNFIPAPISWRFVFPKIIAPRDLNLCTTISSSVSTNFNFAMNLFATVVLYPLTANSSLIGITIPSRIDIGFPDLYLFVDSGENGQKTKTKSFV